MTTIEPAEQPAVGEHMARVALRERAFRILLAMQLVNTSAQITLFVTQAWYVNAAAPPGREAVYLGLMGALRGVIFLGYVLFGGSLADRFARRQVLLISQTAAFAMIVVIGTLILGSDAESTSETRLLVTILLFSTFGLIQGQDRPTRTSMVRDSVPEAARASAITMFELMSGLANLVAAPFALLAVDTLGMGETYLLAALGPATVLLLLLRLPRGTAADAEARRTSLLRNVSDGISVMRTQPEVRWVILLTWSSTALGMSLVAMLIVTWATEVLSLSASAWGVMEIFWGGGSLAGSIMLTIRSNQGSKGRLLFGSSLLLGLGALALSLTRSVPLAFLAYGVAGLGFALMNTVGVTIIQAVVPNRLMGRVTGLLLIGGGLMHVATLPIGVIVAVVGIESTFVAGSTLLLLVTLVVAWRQPGLRRLD